MTTLTAGQQIMVASAWPYTADPSISTLSNGDVVVSWTFNDRQYYPELNVYTRVVSAGGSSLSSGSLASISADQGQQDSQVLALDDGRYMVIWDDSRRFDGVPNHYYQAQLVSRVFNADGTPTSGEVLLEDALPDWALANVEVARLANGNVIAVWFQNSDAPGAPQLPFGRLGGIAAQLLSADGTPIGANFRLNVVVDGQQSVPDVTALKNGGFVATWQTFGDTGDGNHAAVIARVFGNDGAALSAEIRVNATTAGGQIDPKVTGLENGGFFVTWEDASKIMGRIFDADGDAVSGEFRVNTGSGRTPEVVSTVDGHIVVTWYANTGESQIVGQVLSATGEKVGGEFIVAEYGTGSNGGNDEGMHLTATPDGGFAIVYAKSAGAGGQGVFVRFYELTPDAIIGTDAGEDLEGGVSADAIDGGGGNDRLWGWDGGDSLIGGDGDDEIGGQSGNDSLYGGAGSDTISGGDGDDLIVGGAAQDTLIGGGGIDTFRFDVLDGTHDRVKSFVEGEDRIELSASAFAALAGYGLGALDDSELVLGTKATKAGQHLIYNKAKGQLLYDADGAGGQAAVIIAAFTNKPDLSAEDIFII